MSIREEASWVRHAYDMCVKVQDGALHIIVDADTAEFIVAELPRGDEVTKLIANGVVALVCDDVPVSWGITRLNREAQ